MAQNFLYMFEFVVDDLLITHPNECAPDEYPTCVNITFRSSVYVSICDRDFGGCIDIRNLSKSGKCCLFGLESPVNDKDKLNVQVFKKKIEKCKFLLGATDIVIKPIFDRVTSDFIQNNPSIEKLKDKKDDVPRQEEYCPSSEIEKKLLSLFDLNGKQTGNMVLIIRLSCMGPTIVSPFPFSKGCARTCGGGEASDSYRVRGGESDKVTVTATSTATPAARPQYSKKSKTNKNTTNEYNEAEISRQRAGNDTIIEFTPGNRAFATDTSLNETPRIQDELEDDENNYFQMAPRQRAGADDDSISSSNSESDVPSTPLRRRTAGANDCCAVREDEYDEFEADMNGSGLSIRVLKDCFQVNVQDSDYESDDACGKPQSCSNDAEFQQSRFLNTQLRSQTGGSFINRRGLPKIRGTIKYAANECPENANFELPMPVIRKCGGGDNKADKYRKRCPVSRCCCIQVQPDEIDDTLQHINRKTRRDGIEICRKKCIDEEGDVFLFKLGKKKRCSNKQHLIEIELRTPKVPTVLNKQYISVSTQVDEVEIDSELQNICAKKKGAGGKKKGKK